MNQCAEDCSKACFVRYLLVQKIVLSILAHSI